MIAVAIQPEITLIGIAIPPHRVLEVVEDVNPDEEERHVLSEGEARALVDAGLAEPIVADFERLAELMDGWQHA